MHEVGSRTNARMSAENPVDLVESDDSLFGSDSEEESKSDDDNDAEETSTRQPNVGEMWEIPRFNRMNHSVCIVVEVGEGRVNILSRAGLQSSLSTRDFLREYRYMNEGMTIGQRWQYTVDDPDYTSVRTDQIISISRALYFAPLMNVWYVIVQEQHDGYNFSYRYPVLRLFQNARRLSDDSGAGSSGSSGTSTPVIDLTGDDSGAGGSARGSRSSSSASRGTKRKQRSERQPKVGDRWTNPRSKETYILVSKIKRTAVTAVDIRNAAINGVSMNDSGKWFIGVLMNTGTLGKKQRLNAGIMKLNWSYKDSVFAVGAEWQAGIKETATITELVEYSGGWYVRFKIANNNKTLMINEFLRLFRYTGDKRHTSESKKEDQQKRFLRNFFQATFQGRVSNMKVLYAQKSSHSIKMDSTNRFGQTPLHVAALRGHFEAAKWILQTFKEEHAGEEDVDKKLKAFILKRDKPQSFRTGKSAFDYAASSGKAGGAKMVELFLDMGVERGETTCSLCGEALGERVYVIKLPCGHFFHKRCINEWYAKQTTSGSGGDQNPVYSYALESTQSFTCPLCKAVHKASVLEGSGYPFVVSCRQKKPKKIVPQTNPLLAVLKKRLEATTDEDRKEALEKQIKIIEKQQEKTADGSGSGSGSASTSSSDGEKIFVYNFSRALKF